MGASFSEAKRFVIIEKGIAFLPCLSRRAIQMGITRTGLQTKENNMLALFVFHYRFCSVSR
jgi:hypothetical protein